MINGPHGKWNQSGQRLARRRQLGAPLPHEGENGLFSESWFPICLSREIPAGKILGVDFLDGRVVAYRGAKGEARVMSAYCAHVGADLSVGDIQGDTIRCAFHHWRYDGNGVCVATKVGDPPPPAACLFKFPTCEKHGIVFAYNGERPRFEVPDFPYPDSELMMTASSFPQITPTDPWVISCNTPDMQHIKALHGITFDQEDPHDSVEWTDHSMLYDFKGRHAKGEPIEYRDRNFRDQHFLSERHHRGAMVRRDNAIRPAASRTDPCLCDYRGAKGRGRRGLNRGIFARRHQLEIECGRARTFRSSIRFISGPAR